MNNNDNCRLPAIQLLIPSCVIVDEGQTQLAWLDGYCLVTYIPGDANVKVDGVVRIGERFAENLEIIRDLTDALDPQAQLAGYDLTAVIGQLGRLPKEASDPQPALDLLAKIKAMLDLYDPIDLAIDINSQTEVTAQLSRNNPGDNDTRAVSDLELGEIALLANPDYSNPYSIAADLTELASAYMLAIGQLYIPEELLPAFRDAVEGWERNVKPQLPQTAFADDKGGEKPIKD